MGSPTRFICVTQTSQPQGRLIMVNHAKRNIVFEISGQSAYKVLFEAVGQVLV